MPFWQWGFILHLIYIKNCRYDYGGLFPWEPWSAQVSYLRGKSRPCFFDSFFYRNYTGVFSAYLSSKIKIMPLLSGILTMTMLYSINLRINGKSNIVFSKENNIFSLINVGNEDISRIVLLFIIVFIIKFIIDLFLKTKAGYMLLVTGDNESLVKSLGQNPDKYKYIGLDWQMGL